jgi:hypothetical protein
MLFPIPFVRPLARQQSARPTKRSPKALTLESLEDRCVPSADAVLRWNAIALDAIKNDSFLGANIKQPGPDLQARALAIVQIAVFDAVNSIDGSYDPYLTQVDAPPDASITAAVAQAGHDTLVNLFPDYKSVLDADLAADLAGVANRSASIDGALVGQVTAAAILAARANDGADLPMTYTFGSGPGAWQADPLHPTQHPLGPMWGDVTPFAMNSTEQFHVPPPPALTSQAYTDAFNQVKYYGGDGVTTPTLRTADQTQIALFWAYDGTPGLGAPPREYNQVAETIAVQQGNTVVQNARLFALVNIAMADASIACWDGKYDYNLWRPVTGIREAGTDGNPDTTADPNWIPLGAPADNGTPITDPNHPANFTPPFPSYASGHATFGGALFTTLADFYGTDNIHFTLHSDEFNGVNKDQYGNTRDPNVTRSYTSFSQAAAENAMSRIYLGIHWSFDAVQGVQCGDSIGNFVFANLLKARSRHDGGSHDNGGGGDDGGNGVFSDFHHSGSGPNGHGAPMAVFRAAKEDGAVVLRTLDGKKFDQRLSTHPASATIPTTATGKRDAAALAKDLILYLNKGTWGGANRGGHTLVVNLDGDGDLFKVF